MIGDLVYPDGRRATVHDLPEIGSEVDGFRVDFIDEATAGHPVIYLGLHYGQASLVKLAYIVVEDERYPLTLAEAAELAFRLRRRGGDEPGSALNTVAVRL